MLAAYVIDEKKKERRSRLRVGPEEGVRVIDIFKSMESPTYVLFSVRRVVSRVDSCERCRKSTRTVPWGSWCWKLMISQREALIPERRTKSKRDVGKELPGLSKNKSVYY